MVLQHVGLPQTVLKIPVPNIQMSRKLMKYVDIFFCFTFLGNKTRLKYCEESAGMYLCRAKLSGFTSIFFCPFIPFHHSNKSTRTKIIITLVIIYNSELNYYHHV